MEEGAAPEDESEDSDVMDADMVLCSRYLGVLQSVAVATQ